MRRPEADCFNVDDLTHENSIVISTNVFTQLCIRGLKQYNPKQVDQQNHVIIELGLRVILIITQFQLQCLFGSSCCPLITKPNLLRGTLRSRELRDVGESRGEMDQQGSTLNCTVYMIFRTDVY